MKVLLFGATGMVGQGVLRECLLDPNVQLVQTVGRTAIGAQYPKLREIVRQDLWHYEAIEANLSGFDACFFCLHSRVDFAGQELAGLFPARALVRNALELFIKDVVHPFHVCDHQNFHRLGHLC
jgi:uncharacterized protein YbjT (DUF2867 family)